MHSHHSTRSDRWQSSASRGPFGEGAVWSGEAPACGRSGGDADADAALVVTCEAHAQHLQLACQRL
eukprot:91749-Rhodomonas_salina.1